jgi:hypothetical protein
MGRNLPDKVSSTGLSDISPLHARRPNLEARFSRFARATLKKKRKKKRQSLLTGKRTKQQAFFEQQTKVQLHNYKEIAFLSLLSKISSFWQRGYRFRKHTLLSLATRNNHIHICDLNCIAPSGLLLLLNTFDPSETIQI